MKELPILFNGDMVRAILDGRKTQTRRLITDKDKEQLSLAARLGEISDFLNHSQLEKNDLGYLQEFCPIGSPGDQIWVRETWSAHWMYDTVKPSEIPNDEYALIRYEADKHTNIRCNDLGYFKKKRPSIFMPRWASRIQLEITDIRVERLQDISILDINAEGTPKGKYAFNDPWIAENSVAEVRRHEFIELWDSCYSSWDLNPWVWVIEFKRITARTRACFLIR